MASINQAHLIHDASGGRSSTRLHAPPGGHSSMGTSFGWAEEAPQQPRMPRKDPNASSFCFGGDEAPAPQRQQAPAPVQQQAPPLTAHQMRQRKNEFHDNRIGAGVVNENNNQAQQQQQQPTRAGFGDTGASSVKVHAPPGGKSSGNIIGGWN